MKFFAKLSFKKASIVLLFHQRQAVGQLEPVDPALAERAEDAVSQSRILFFEVSEHGLHGLAFGRFVLGTRTLQDGQGRVGVAYVIAHVLFLRVEQRTDQGEVAAREVSDGREAPEPPR